MELPADLVGAIAVELAGESRALERASAELTDAYRGVARDGRPLVRTAEQRGAYLAVRMPATFAATFAALAETAARLPAGPASILDLGAGPGTATWAAMQVWPDLRSATLLERDPELVALGQRLALGAEAIALRQAAWQSVDLGVVASLTPHDVVVAAFVLGELSERSARALVAAAFGAARLALVIVEPGTPAGFERVRAWRDLGLECGAHVIAPCPHQRACPMASGDWCHFAARVERSGLHRRLKGGALGHEDEKYSYLVLAREAHAPAAARILRHARLHRGHAQIDLCTPAGLERRTVSRKHGEAWRQVRRARWGDAWPCAPKAG